MAETSLVWDGTATGDAGTYTSDEWRIVFKQLGAALRDNEGVIGGSLNSLRPSSPGNDQIKAETGYALVDGTLYENTAAVTKTMSTPAVGTTGKRLVLQKGWTAQTVRLAVIASSDGTASIPALTQTDGVTWEIPIVSFTHATNGAIAAVTDEREFTRPAGFQIVVADAGAVITTGIKFDLEVVADMEMTSWSCLGDASGTVQFDLWVDSYANFPPTVADTITTGGTKPNLSGATKNQGSMADYATVKLTKGQILRVNVDSSPAPATVTRVLLALKGWRA